MKYLKRNTLFFIFFFLLNTSFIVNAQNFSKDSLRIELLNKTSILFLEQSKDSALFYVNEALINAKKLKFNNLIAVSYYNKARIYEHWKEIENAEENYINWYSIRKEQGGNKYRWALSGMRRFYTETKQIEKLKKIDREWMLVLDKQYDDNIQSEWNSNKSPVEEYRLSLYPVLFNLVKLEQYFFAEELLIHMFEKSEDLRKINWSNSDFLYYRADGYMAKQQDTASLTLWYKHWFETIDKYYPYDYNIVESTLFTLSWDYPEEYLTPDMREKYEKLFLDIAFKYGGYETYEKLLFSKLYYNKTWNYSRIKLTLTALQISIITNNQFCTNKYLIQLDEFVNSFSVTEANLKEKIEKLIAETPVLVTNKNITKWKAKTIQELE